MSKSLAVRLVAACTLLLSLGAVSSVAGQARRLDAGADTRIVNGVETQSRPTTGALLSSLNRQLCSGTLVGCETFVTAAHCVCPGNTFCTPNPAAFAVYLQHAGIVSVGSIDVHPQYQFGETSDIAVLTLSSPIDGIPPTPINDGGDPPAGTGGVIAGFGIVDGNNGRSGLLREGHVTTAACSAAPEPAHVCWNFANPIGSPGTDSNTCSGDSGGPLLADLGAGEILVGVTSGGDSYTCRAPDNSFDTNVFQNAAFIQSIGGADLLNTACGGISQVGDVDTAIIAVSTSGISNQAQTCRKEIRKQYWKYTSAVLKAEAACLDDVGHGSIAGPCPGGRAQSKIAQAVAKADPARIARKCPAAILPSAGAAGGCAGAADASDLANCIVAAGDAAVATLLSVSYADDTPAGPIAEAACQAGIGKATIKYQRSSLKALNTCQQGLDHSRVAGCPDTRTTTSIAKARSKVEPAIAAACTDAQVASLDGAAGFGGSCAGSVTASGLAGCQISDYDATSSALITLLDSPAGTGTLGFDVAAGTDRLRVTLNGIEEGNNDVDLYARLGAPPTMSLYDARSNNNGVFEGLEIVSPAAGEWFVLVDEVAGNDIPTQLTITMFQP